MNAGSRAPRCRAGECEAVARDVAYETHYKQAHHTFLAKHLFISTELQMVILPAVLALMKLFFFFVNNSNIF